MGYLERSHFARSRRASPSVSSHPGTQRESLIFPHALGTRLGFLAPAVEADCRFQAAQRQPEPFVQPGNKEGIIRIDGVCREGLWQNKVESRGLARPCRAFHISDPGRTGLPRFAVAMAVPAQRKLAWLAGCLHPAECRTDEL